MIVISESRWMVRIGMRRKTKLSCELRIEWRFLQVEKAAVPVTDEPWKYNAGWYREDDSPLSEVSDRGFYISWLLVDGCELLVFVPNNQQQATNNKSQRNLRMGRYPYLDIPTGPSINARWYSATRPCLWEQAGAFYIFMVSDKAGWYRESSPLEMNRMGSFLGVFLCVVRNA